jgi:SAM-dependent methyltransferase
MNYSEEWDECYRKRTHLSIWPWSDMVSLAMKVKPHKKFKVLELGCGAGANIPLFSALGADYYAVEGSKTIVKELHHQYPAYKNNIVVGDFTKDIPNEQFDLIVDRAALTHNSESAIIACLKKCHQQLANDGKFIGVDWFSTKYSDYKKGEQAEDVWTRTNFIDGSFANTGRVHFSDKNHLLDLFKNFEILELRHKTQIEEFPKSEWVFASWNFVALKHE